MPSPPIRPYGGLSPYRAKVRVEGGTVVVPEPRRKIVAIFGAGGVRHAPWESTDVECWSLNNFWNASRDSDGRIAASRWWEMHQIFPNADGPDAGLTIQDPNDMAWIRQCPVPLYTTEPYPDNPNAVVWPIEYFARKYRDYFTCTFAMQIIQAFDEGFEELRIYGLELLLGTKREATVESSCVAYWLGYVEGRGMKVSIMPSANNHNGLGRMDPRQQFILAHPYRYGHEYWEERRFTEEYASRWDERALAV